MARHKKDLETIFKENERQLRMMPSNQAWRKLERKLETRRTRHRVIPIKYMSMAAALVALIAVIWVFSSVFDSNQTANQSAAELNFEVEDLVNIENPTYDHDRASEYLARFASQDSNPAINEGEKEKSLITKKNRDI
jgi:hypothetical protein